MSGMKLVRSLAVVATAFVVTGAFAAGSMNMEVSAEVRATCKLMNVDAMPFVLDPSAGGNVNQTSTVTYRCTKNTPPPKLTVGTIGGGTYSSGAAGALVGPTGNAFTIPFSVKWTDPADPGNGLGTSGDQTVTLTGTILEAAYLDAPAATYSKLVPVAITP